MALIDDLKASFPWIAQLGLSGSWFHNTAATSASSAEIVQKIRNTPQYKQRFPGLTRQDGTLRMTEAQYIQQEGTYRTLLKQYGFNEADYRTPATLVGFFQSEIAPSELQDRLQVYKQVKEGGQNIKDAFYVYAGLDLSDDDLFEATVDPAAEQNLRTAYNQRVAGQKFDYQTYITRATHAGLGQLVKELQRLQARGAVTAEAVQRIQSVDPAFARQIMDAIYHGGKQGGQAGSLDLQTLLTAFTYAGIGAAAKNAGLELPTKERLAEILAAGVDRQKAIEAYTEYGFQKKNLNAAVLRARGSTFTQKEFEASEFLGNVKARNELEAGLTYMRAAGADQGEFAFDQNRQGRFIQSGFTNY